MYKYNDIIGSRYQVIKTIGSGGMSEVYLAYDKVLDIEIAIKILQKDTDSDISRFRREAEIIERLDNKHIVKIYDFNQTKDNKYYIVMEYIKGTTIKEYIKKYGKFSPEEVVNITKQILNALGYAHKKNVIHRDIKSNNIMITDNKIIKIMDFGIAKLSHGEEKNLTHAGTVLGTTYYIAPEFLTKGNPENNSDIYSLGIVLYEMLVGNVPFKGESFEVICMKHLQSKIPDIIPKLKIPQALENILIKSTAKKNINRYQTAEEMIDDLNTVFDKGRYDEDKLILYNDIDDDNDKTVIYDATNIYKVDDVEKKIKINSKKKKRNIILGVSIIVILVSLIGILNYRNNQIIVPDVIGQEEQVVIETFESLEILNIEFEYEENKEVIEGTVIRTEPAAGEKISIDEIVIVVISSGVGAIELPNFKGQNITDVVASLVELELEYNIVYEENKEKEDVVFDQLPEAGINVRPGEDVVTVYVSEGEKQIVVANLLGLSLEEAETWASEYGIIVQKSYKCNNTYEEGLIYDQSPK